MTEYITQDQAVALAVAANVGRVLKPIGLNTNDVLYCDASYRTPEITALCNAAIQHYIERQEPTGWISAKDRMPPPQVRVLGFEPQYNIVDVDMWFGPDFNWGYSYWMPLPPPPTGENE